MYQKKIYFLIFEIKVLSLEKHMKGKIASREKSLFPQFKVLYQKLSRDYFLEVCCMFQTIRKKNVFACLICLETQET